MKPVFKSRVNHGVNRWQSARGDPIPGNIGQVIDLPAPQNTQAYDHDGRRHSQVIQDKVSDVFQKDEVGGEET